MMPSPAGSARARRRYGRFLGLAATLAVGLVAVAWLPTRHLAGAAGPAALVTGCAIAWFGSAVGGLPVMLAEVTGRPTVAMVLSSTALRPMAVLAIALAFALSGRLPTAPLLVGAALAHLVLLVVDTLYAAGACGARVPIFGPPPVARSEADRSEADRSEPDRSEPGRRLVVGGADGGGRTGSRTGSRAEGAGGPEAEVTQKREQR